VLEYRKMSLCTEGCIGEWIKCTGLQKDLP